MKLSDFSTTSAAEFQGVTYVVTTDIILPLAESSIIGLSAPDDNYIVTLPNSVNNGVKAVIGNTGSTKIKIKINDNEYYALLPDMVMTFVKRDSLTWFVIKECEDYPIIPDNYTTKDFQYMTSPTQIITTTTDMISSHDGYTDTIHKIMPIDDTRYLLVTKNSRSDTTADGRTFNKYFVEEIMIFEYDELLNITSYAPFTTPSLDFIKIIGDNLIATSEGFFIIDSNNIISASTQSTEFNNAKDVIITETNDKLIIILYGFGGFTFNKYNFDNITNTISNKVVITYIHNLNYRIDHHDASKTDVCNAMDYRTVTTKIKDNNYMCCVQHWYCLLADDPSWAGLRGSSSEYRIFHLEFTNSYSGVNIYLSEPLPERINGLHGSDYYNNIYQIDKLSDKYLMIYTKVKDLSIKKDGSNHYYTNFAQKQLSFFIYDVDSRQIIRIHDFVNCLAINQYSTVSCWSYSDRMVFFKAKLDPTNSDICLLFSYGTLQDDINQPGSHDRLYIRKISISSAFTPEDYVIDIGNIPAGIPEIIINDNHDLSFISYDGVQYMMHNVKIFKG